MKNVLKPYKKHERKIKESEMKKVIFALTVATLILCILPFGTYAAEFDENSDISPTYTDFYTENPTIDMDFRTTSEDIYEKTVGNSSTLIHVGENFTDMPSISGEENDHPVENVATNEASTAISGGNTTQNAGTSTTEGANSENSAWSDAILGTAEEYASEIFCVLTFIGSLITAFCYKKGLLPTLADGINKIYSVVVNAGEKTNSLQAESAELLDAFVDRAMPILEKAKEVSGYAEMLHEETLSLKEEIEIEKAERRVLSHILSGQIDMLYGVFMSANLPEYEKEQLGAQYNRLKGMICEENTNEGEN